MFDVALCYQKQRNQNKSSHFVFLQKAANHTDTDFESDEQQSSTASILFILLY